MAKQNLTRKELSEKLPVVTSLVECRILIFEQPANGEYATVVDLAIANNQVHLTQALQLICTALETKAASLGLSFAGNDRG